MIKFDELSNNSLVPLSLLSQKQWTPLAEQDDLEGLIKKYNRKSNFTSGKAGENFARDYTEMSQKYYSDLAPIPRAYVRMKRFLELEHQITSRELFWVLFGSFYPQGEMNCMFLEELEVALKRNKRDQANYSTTARWSNFLMIRYAEWMIREGNKDYYKPDIGKYVKQLRSIPDMEPITIYRGFLCRKELGKQIRESNDKGDAGYWTQIEGRGTSYTLKRDMAATFAIRRTDVTTILKILDSMCKHYPMNRYDHLESVHNYHKKMATSEGYKEIVKEVARVLGWEVIQGNEDETLFYLNIKDTIPISELVDKMLGSGSSWVLDIVKDLVEDGWTYASDMDMSDEWKDTDTYEGFGVRPVIGKYKVFKSDIMDLHDKFGEAEIIVLPESVSFERYDFLTTDEIIVAMEHVTDELNPSSKIKRVRKTPPHITAAVKQIKD